MALENGVADLESPPEEKGYVKSPSEENGNLETPSQENGNLETPSQENGNLQTPSEENGYVKSPSEEDGYLQNPSQENGDLQNPSQENGNLQTPSHENGYVKGPSEENGYLQNPSQENGDLQNPSQENGNLQTPSHENGYVKSPSEENGYLQNPSQENGHLQYPSQENGNLPTPSQDNVNLRNPSQENGFLYQKIDDLQATVNRLSQSFYDYMQSNPPPQQKEQLKDADDMRLDFTKDENKDRGNWSGRLDFILACLGYAIGLGNVWRFPFLCYKHGGAVFFIPYVIFLIFVGMPIFLLELTLGQYTSRGPLRCWEMAPIFRGVGMGMLIVSTFLGIYYNVIIAWAIFYFFASFTSDLPWSHCDRDWNDKWCADRLLSNITEAECIGGYDYREGVCWNATTQIPIAILNKTVAKNFSYAAVLPAEQYLYNYALGTARSTGMEDLGGMSWPLPLCLLLAWVLVVLSLIKGIKSSGKVVYFTALFPFAVLIILLIRGVTLPGAEYGIRFYIANVKWEKLRDPQVWQDAAVQIFFSLSDGFGGLIALASYNRFHNDALRDTLVVTLGNCFTSFFAGFAIFSSIGYLATELGVPIEEVAKGGTGLAFVIYPSAVNLIPGSTFWAIIFFAMLITLGLDSEFALMETVSTVIMDQWPETRNRKWAVISVVGVIGFFLGLPMVTDGGAYLLDLIDHYSIGWNVLLIALSECLCVGWVYGFWNFTKDLEVILGNRGCGCMPWKICSPWWMLCISALTPIFVAAVMVYTWIFYTPFKSGSYEYPVWAHAMGALCTVFCIVAMLVTAIISLVTQPGKTFKEKFLSSIRPSKYWGPALVKHRRKVKHIKNFDVDPYNEETEMEKGDDIISYKF